MGKPWPHTKYYPPVAEYEPFDDVQEGEIVWLGRHPRRVLEIRRTPHDDAIRTMDIARLRGVGNPVSLFRADLKSNPTYRYKGRALPEGGGDD